MKPQLPLLACKKVQITPWSQWGWAQLAGIRARGLGAEPAGRVPRLPRPLGVAGGADLARSILRVESRCPRRFTTPGPEGGWTLWWSFWAGGSSLAQAYEDRALSQALKP